MKEILDFGLFNWTTRIKGKIDKPTLKTENTDNNDISFFIRNELHQNKMVSVNK